MRGMLAFATTALVLALLVIAMPWADDAAADGSARYRLEVSLDWTPETHPADYPSNPHFSRLIGAAHNGRYALFADGETASSGLGLVATNGRTAVLEAELAEAKRRGRVSGVVIGSGLRRGSGTISETFRVTDRHSRISFATMLAPSPDWFTGLSSVDLREGDDWIAEREFPLWVWDAGVDEGQTFEAENAPVQPRESVRLATGAPFLSEGGLQRIGTATLTRIDGGTR